jgi:hypothetical protein
MPKNIAALEIDELGTSPASEDIAVGGLVRVASMMVTRVLRLDVHKYFAGNKIPLSRKVWAP